MSHSPILYVCRNLWIVGQRYSVQDQFDDFPFTIERKLFGLTKFVIISRNQSPDQANSSFSVRLRHALSDAYDIVDASNEMSIGVITDKTLLFDNFLISSPAEDAIGTIKFRKLFFFGAHYDICSQGRVVGSMTLTRTDLFEIRMTINFSKDFDDCFDERIAIAVALLILARVYQSGGGGSGP